jgi:folate-dependent phosphoribosylglycinamide formyltransferase PurN
MKVALLTSQKPNQVALCHKIAERFELRAVLVSRNIRPLPPPERQSLLYRAAGRLIRRRLNSATELVQQRYRGLYPRLPALPTEEVDNINDPLTVQWINQREVDLILVSGTNLLARQTIERLRAPILNLHPGICPAVKGSPNPTNWCLSKGWFHLIGSSVLWVDPGIDSGPVVATEQTPLSGDESLSELHWKVVEHSHDLYLRSVQAIRSRGMLPGVDQARLGAGQTFYNRDWGLTQAFLAQIHFALFFKPGVRRRGRPALVELPAPVGPESRADCDHPAGSPKPA